MSNTNLIYKLCQDKVLQNLSDKGEGKEFWYKDPKD